MIKIGFSEETWRYVVTLNGVTYASCDTIEDAKKEAKNARRELRYGI